MVNYKEILKKIEKLIEKLDIDKIKKKPFSENMLLIGENSAFDSNNLVELCIGLEDIALQDNFEFDWTSEKAMSEFNSIFKNPKSLALEYIRQYNLIL